MDTDSIYSKLNMNHEEYVKILEKNKDLFGKEIGSIEPESLNNPIQEGVFLSSKSYSYICKKDIPDNKHKIKNNMLHTKGIMNSYSQQYIDHNLFKETLLNNYKPQKISFNTISVNKTLSVVIIFSILFSIYNNYFLSVLFIIKVCKNAVFSVPKYFSKESTDFKE